ncbi:MAG: hypothetical protein HY824_15850 [Acidobacteria bacterium]|nr:hypothetical protein [Acidobacteriota bacterium]
MSMRRPLGAVLAAAAGLLAGSPALAHHSVPGTFHTDKTVAIKGTISRIDWINPHIYIYVDVKDKAGVATTWKVETLPTNHMRRAGVSKALIMDEAKGGEVTVYMYPAIKNPAAGFLLRIVYPEGHFYHLYGEESEIARASN